MDLTSYIILVPIDFSEQSIAALEQAERNAISINGELVLLSIIKPSGLLKSLFIDDESDVDYKLELQLKLEQLAKEVTIRSGIVVNATVTKGKVYQKIVEVAELVSANLIVMGTNGAPSGFSKKIIGSNAYRVISSSSCPVITIKGLEHIDNFRTIILPLDLEKETKQKVRYALKLSRLYNSMVKIVSVVNNKDDNESLARLKANLNQVNFFLSEGGVKTTAELISIKGSSFSKSILDYSNKYEADLIIIMTQEENDFSYNVLGSEAKYIINNSEIPVMSIRPLVKIAQVYSLP